MSKPSRQQIGDLVFTKKDYLQWPVESDSDEDEPAKKKPAQEFGSSLSALLPQPKNRYANATDPMPLPYVFTKNKNVDLTAHRLTQQVNPSQSVSPTPVPKSTMPTVLSPSDIKAAAKTAALQVTKQIIQDDDEEDDDEGVASGNFFSIPDRSELLPIGNEPYYRTSFVEQVTSPSPYSTEHTGYTNEQPQQQLLNQQEILQPNLADAPLDFRKPSGPSNIADGPSGSRPSEHRTDYSNQRYTNYPEFGDATGPYYSDYYTSSSYENSDPPVVAEDQSTESYIDEEALRRLQGKRNRGREEINFVEIKGDDQLKGTQQWLTKSLTEEKSMKSFSKKKGEQPTGQQRRKHQITYLIHQAKERELELKNTWSENKLTRRQTQAKYGF